MKPGYRPFESVDAYLDWYFASMDIIETTTRNNLDADGLDDILIDLSIRTFLPDFAVQELRALWEKQEDMSGSEYYWALWIRMEQEGWILDTAIWNTLKKVKEDIMFPDKPTMTAAEVGELMGVGPRHVYRLIKEGKIPTTYFTRIGGTGEFRFFTKKMEQLFEEWARRF